MTAPTLLDERPILAPRCPQHRPEKPDVCPWCRTRARTRSAVRRYEIAMGTWEGKEPIAEVAAHIAKLHTEHGMSYRLIANHAGVSYSNVLDVARGENASCLAVTRTAILAVTPVDDPTEVGFTNRTSSVGTRRRVRGMAAEGWSNRVVGAHFGVTTQAVYQWAATDQVLKTTAARLAVLCDELETLPAPVPAIAAAAQRRGWVPLYVWGADIDDPAAIPAIPDPESYVDDVKVANATRGELPHRDLTRAELSATVRILTRRGSQDPQIAELLHWLDSDGAPAVDAVHWWRRQHGIPAGIDWHGHRNDPGRVAAAVAGDLAARDLSTREREVAVRQLAGEGLTDREIAARLRWAGPGRGMGAVRTFRVEHGIESGHPNGGRIRLPRSA